MSDDLYMYVPCPNCGEDMKMMNTVDLNGNEWLSAKCDNCGKKWKLVDDD